MNCECLNTKYALISQNILVGGETEVFSLVKVFQIHLSDAYMYNSLLSHFTPLHRFKREL